MKKYQQLQTIEDDQTLICLKNLNFSQTIRGPKQKAILSPNSKYLLIDQYLWDVDSDQLLTIFEDISLVVSPCFSFNSVYLALLLQGNIIKVYSLEKGSSQILLIKVYCLNIQFHYQKEELLINHMDGFDIYQMNNGPLCLYKFAKLINNQTLYYSKHPNYLYKVMSNKLGIWNRKSMKQIRQFNCQETLEKVEDSLSQNCLLMSTDYGSILIIELIKMHIIRSIKLDILSKSCFAQKNNTDMLIKLEKLLKNQKRFDVLTVVQLLPEIKIIRNKIILKRENRIDTQIFLQNYVIRYNVNGTGSIWAW